MEKRPIPKGTKTKKATTPEILKFKRNFDPNYKGTTTGEVNTEPSKTIPDMSLTINQLMAGHTTNVNEPQYFDQEIPRYDDITDMVAHKEELKQRLKDAEAQIKAEKQKKIADAEEAIKKAAEAAKIKKEEVLPDEKL